MSRLSFAVLFFGACLVLALGARPARAQAADSIAPFELTTAGRAMHGAMHNLDLAAGPLGLGQARVFFGLDSLSTAEQQYLTSGLQWSFGPADTPMFGVAALQTEAREPAAFQGQRLLRVQNRLNPNHKWYLPQLQTQLFQVRNSGGDTALSPARGVRIGLSEALGPAAYELSYAHADTRFDALGSPIAAGERSFEIDSRYAIGTLGQLTHDLHFYPADNADKAGRVVQRWVWAQSLAAGAGNTPWQLSARLGDAQGSSFAPLPVGLELTAATAHWRSWRLDSSLGWYRAGTRATLGLPVEGTLWRVSARRRVNIAGIVAVLSPSFSFGGSRDADHDYACRTGLELGVSRLSDAIDFSIDYRSTAWRAHAGPGAVRLLLRYTRSAGSIVSGLRAAARHLRLPWQRRY